MKTKHKRSEKIASLINRQLSILFTTDSRYLYDKRLHQVRIIDVEFPKGAAQAKVFYFVKDERIRLQIDKLLFKAKGIIRHYIAQRVILRSVPHLHFVYDETLVRGARIQSLINQLPDHDHESLGSSDVDGSVNE